MGTDQSWVLTWVAIAASILMGLGGVCLFVYAVKKDLFRDIEEAKYHVFWSDLEELVDRSQERAGTSGKQE
ncbi:MAG: hypothetical protein HY820_08785 [Acidobacteria bacterium]|nr:hypothetical protein [Acidobacteriota bacterium]